MIEVFKQEEPEYRLLHRIADGLRPDMIQAFLSAVANLAGRSPRQRIEQAVAQGDLGGAEAAIPWEDLPQDLGSVAAVVQEALIRASEAAGGQLPRSISLSLRFDLLNRRAVEFVQQHTGSLIREVTVETRMAVRDVISRAFFDGMPPRDAARHIRDLVGLTRRQAQAVDNLRRSLAAEGTPLARAQIQAADYAERLLLERARNIARTETIRAANMGQQLLWEQGVEQGLINPGRTRKVWIVTPDDRLCPFCRPMEGQEVELNDFFISPRGMQPVPAPPLHPSCRCAMRLKFLRR